MTDFLQHFAEDFSALNVSNLHRLGELYSHDVHFRDPLQTIQGLAALQEYFAELYTNVSQLSFSFHGYDQLRDGAGYLRWTLLYCHPRLRRGQPISVEGCSHLLWRDKVYQHHDYFDAGALLYEHLPLMGPAIGWLKGRLA